MTVQISLQPARTLAVAATSIALAVAGCVSTRPIYTPPDSPVAALPAPRFIAAPPSQCVPYARARSGIQIIGDASDWWRLAGEDGYPRAHEPQAGAVIVLQVDAAGRRGHVAYVQRVVSSREIIVDHANWHGRREVAVGVPVIDVSPGNDWSQVRVLWVETGQMGARTYPALGFVLPSRAWGA